MNVSEADQESEEEDVASIPSDTPICIQDDSRPSALMTMTVGGASSEIVTASQSLRGSLKESRPSLTNV